MDGVTLFSTEEIRERSLEEIYPWMKDKNFECVLDPKKVKEIVDAAIKTGLTAFDLETSGLDTRVYDGVCNTFIAGFCMSYDGITGYYIPVNHGKMNDGKFARDSNICIELESIRSDIQRLLDNCVCVYHNSPYDLAVLKGNGFKIPEFANPVQNIPVKVGKARLTVKKLAWEDTFCLAYLWDSSLKNKGLKNLSEVQLNMRMLELKDLFKDSNILFYLLDPVSNRDCTVYACSDAICTWHLYHFLKSVKDEQPFIYYTEMRCALSTLEMGANFSRIDIEKAKQLKSKLVGIRKEVETEATRLLGREINLASPAQVADALLNDFKIDVTAKNEDGTVKKTDKGKVQYETGYEELIPHVDTCPFVDLVLTYRDINKTVGTYLDNFIGRADKNNEVRFKFLQWRVETGRFSCAGGEDYEGYSGVNIQALTKPLKDKDKKDPETGQLYNFDQLVRKKGSGFFLRSLVVARPGSKIVAIDYSGQELRVAANISDEPVWVKEFLEGDGDLHTQTAKIIFKTNLPDEKMRDASKTINFQTLYGGGPKALSESLGITMEDAKDFQQKMLGGLLSLKKWMDVTKRKAHDTGYAETPLGRHRKLFGINSQDRIEVSKAERNAINTPVQGTGGDMMKLAMALVRDYIALQPKDEVRMLFTVHDELVFEIKEDKLDQHIPELMNIMSLQVILHGAMKWKVPLSMDCEVGDSWEVEYEYFKRHPEALKKLVPNLQFAKCRAMGYDPKTLQPLPKSDKPKETVIEAPKAVQAPANPVPVVPAVSVKPSPPIQEETKPAPLEVSETLVNREISPEIVEKDDLEIINTDNFDIAALDKSIAAFLISTNNKGKEILENFGVDVQKAFYIGLSAYVRTVKKEIIPQLENMDGRELIQKTKNYPECYRDYVYRLKGRYDNVRAEQLDFFLKHCSGGITNYKIYSQNGDEIRSGTDIFPIQFEVLANFHNL